ncbi:MAG TPA: hypothetical protein VHX61_03395 [Rhizomicrobium sp.]|jgi:hypothetical protein|nr:hypothetical protein [Rhizomicrobium sp.]
MNSPQGAYQATITSLARQIQNMLHAHAAAAKVTPEALLRSIINELLGEEELADGRARNWHFRLRLYDPSKPYEPVADTDASRAADQPGEMIIRGLPQILKLIPELASKHHEAPCPGLEEAMLRRKLGSLRTMLAARKDGTADLRAHYQVTANGVTRYMVARVDICRADSADGRQMPGPFSPYH